MQSKKLKIIVLFSIAFLTILICQFTGYLVRTNLKIGETKVINSFIWFTHVRNHGGIFGSFQGLGWLISIIAFLGLCGLVFYLIVAKDLKLYHYICFGLIIGGGLSNILDRVLFGSVIDFINVQKIPYWRYIFNTADMMIHFGIWPMLLIGLLENSQKKKQET